MAESTEVTEELRKQKLFVEFAIYYLFLVK